MKTVYDEKIELHYDQVAAECGLSPQSTMADEIIRNKETSVILEFVDRAARACRADVATRHRTAAERTHPGAVTVMDVGCGNGYTLKRLATELGDHVYIGVEYNDKLRELAKQQIAGLHNVRVLPGDIRVRESIDVAAGAVDVLICQRVLINLLSVEDARAALNNIVSLVRPDGRLLFIESFAAGLQRLNEARAEFDLEPIGPAHHNRYLEEDFFAHPALVSDATSAPARNTLSTHYYVTRVLHSALSKAQQSEFKRNSHFVKFLSSALPDGVGDYAPLQFHSFVKNGRT
jgi:SAM-dependent methyltransferase